MHGMVAVGEEQQQIGPPTATEGCWFVFRVRAGLEHRVCIWLRLRGMRPYWPRYNPVPRLLQARNKILWRSVMPGYLFLPDQLTNFMLLDELQNARLMRNGDGSFIKIPEHGIQGMERIRAMAAELNDEPADFRGTPFRIGQKVKVATLGVEGKIVKLDGRRRVVVEVPLFGTKLQTTLAVGAIESV